MIGQSIINLFDGIIKGNAQLIVGDYQRRPDSWQRMQHKRLFDDIIRSSERAERGEQAEHYIQTVTLFRGEGRLGDPYQSAYIVDGLQRTTNIFILCAALRNAILNSPELIKEDKYNDCQRDLKRQFLINSESGERKLKLYRQSDDEILDFIVQNDKENLEKLKEIPLIKVYQYYYNRAKLVKRSIPKYYEKGLRNFTWILEECQSERQAIELFIDKNALQKGTTSGEVIQAKFRNAIMDHLTPEESKEITKLIDEVIEYEELTLSSFFTDFLYYSYNEKYSDQTTKEVYMNLLDDPGVDLVRIIKKLYSYYLFDKAWKEKSFNLEPAKHLLESTYTKQSLKDLFVDLFSDKFDGKFELGMQDKVLIYKLCEAYIIRRDAVGRTQHDNKVLAKVLSTALTEDTDSYKNPVDKVRDFLYKRPGKELSVVSDEELRKEGLKSDVYKNNAMRRLTLCILQRINDRFRVIGEPRIYGADSISLDHIMCQKNNDKNPLLNMIGNLTILTSSANSQIRNAKFEEKRHQLYDQSIFKINWYFKENEIEHWTDDEILRRNDYIIDQVIDLWPI